jgi:hypothetical protein
VCRLFRGIPLHNQHTYPANQNKLNNAQSLPLCPPNFFFLQERYFKGIVIPVNSSLPHQNISFYFFDSFFSKPTNGAFYTKVLCHAFGNKDFVFPYSFSLR